MAEDEMTNEQQPDDGAENTGAESPETPEAKTEAGAESAETGEPNTEAGAEAAQSDDAAPSTAAEQLANEALAAARSAVSELENGGSADASDPASTPAAGGSTGSNGTAAAANGASNGAMMGGGAGTAVAPAPFSPEILTQLASVQGGEGIDILADVELNVKIELGKTKMLVEDVLRLTDGAVVELDKLAGDPVDIYVNDRHVARGEVLILNDNFCVRVSEILEATIEE